MKSIALAVAAALAGQALAQTAAPQAASATTAANDDSGQIAEIIVTARRVEERLQDIPASVAAITGDDLAGMQGLSDVQRLVSGVTFQAVGPVPVIGIRGFGNRSQAGNPSNSAAGIFQDGVFVASALSPVINRTDTERLEIAKGPQSTLYGRSSFTGAFNIVTTDPAKTLSGYADVGYGASSVESENLWRAQGAVSLPLSDTLAIRLYALSEERDGYAVDRTTGIRSGGYDRQVFRGKLLWEPTDAITVRLSGAVMKDDTSFAFVNAGKVRAPLGQNILFQNPASAASRAQLSFFDSVWEAKYVAPQHAKIKGDQVTLDLRLQTPLGEVASLTDYQHATLDPNFSLDMTRLNWAVGSSPYYETRRSQELRLARDEGRLSYLAGVYFLEAEVEQGGGKIFDQAAPFATFGPGSLQFDIARVNANYQPAYTKTKAYAGFGQVGYDITDELNLTVGLRYGVDKISGTAGVAIRNVAGIVIPTAPITFRSGEFKATTGSAILSYELAPDMKVYGSFARGNSPGGLNTGAAALVNFGPQNVNAYELGLKSLLLDRRLQLNLAAFENRYEDIQLTQNLVISGALSPLVTNAAKARGRGVDVDAIAVLSPSLRLGLQYTYVESEITSYTVPPPPAPQVNLEGVPLVRSPKHSLNASITYSHDIGPGRFEVSVEENYTSSYTNDYLGVPAGTAYPGIPGVVAAGVTTAQVLGLFPVKSYALTNLSASYAWNDWEVSGSVRNLTNKQYIPAVLAFDLITVPLETAGRPRTYEVGLRYKF
ncbi:MAG: TonB-dependent receptor [Steroidobacteraceae bacterium]|nr:TonB-dependent receptor [Nevskiaceae bacterium]MCP5472506.1 TonB-dependent receptor [Nevskiaceae bacterium]